MFLSLLSFAAQAAVSVEESLPSPDKRFVLLVNRNAEDKENVLSVKLVNTASNEVMWIGSDFTEDISTVDFSASWSPDSMRVVLVYSSVRYGNCLFLHKVNDRFIELDQDLLDLPRAKDIATKFHPKFDAYKSIEWSDKQTVYLRFAGRCQLLSEDNTPNGEYADYEYKLAFTFPLDRLKANWEIIEKPKVLIFRYGDEK